MPLLVRCTPLDARLDLKIVTILQKNLLWRIATLILLAASSAEAQQAAKPLARIGFISSTGAPADRSPHFAAFRLRLRELGYVDGETVSTERRYAEGRLDRVPGLMNELVQEKVDVILATNNVAIRAAKEATKTIPIVMISSIDPVAAGYIESFARPGGNITGLAWLNRDISAKRIELLKEVLPALSRVGILWDTDGPGPAVAFKEYVAAARSFKLELRSLEVRGPTPDFSRVFKDAKTARVSALIVVTNPLIGQRAREVFELASSNHLPSMAEEGQQVNAGGLISYGASLADLYRRAAEYVVEIIKGGKPAEMPVKLPSKFEVFVNLKTAERLGVVIPQHVMLQADKVIKD